jgi:hypothetical protein
MKEQEKDQGDILTVAATMQIVGASYVETLDTKGTDGSNVHLGGPATITGYFGGVGQPNDHALHTSTSSSNITLSTVSSRSST